MEEQPVNIPCPICSVPGKVFMIAHVDEIPYFGEHTQVTVMCHSCGWRQTDFIPAEGKKAGGWRIEVNSRAILSARVIRSSSCTVKVLELDLEVAPGSNATGYVSNVEGVLKRFVDIIHMVLRDVQSEVERIKLCNFTHGLDGRCPVPSLHRASGLELLWDVKSRASLLSRICELTGPTRLPREAVPLKFDQNAQEC